MTLAILRKEQKNNFKLDPRKHFFDEIQYKMGLRCFGIREGTGNENKPYENLQGFMRMLWHNQDELYEGEVVDGMRKGWGRFINDTEGHVYVGEWDEDEMHGQGIMYDIKTHKVMRKGLWERGREEDD